MGQKVHPTGIRLGISKPWVSTWYANSKDFSDQLFGDHKVRAFLTKELKAASVSKIVIERPAKSIRVTIHTARPGVVIGKKGEDVERDRSKGKYILSALFTLIASSGLPIPICTCSPCEIKRFPTS